MTITATGGTPPYSYKLNGIFTGSIITNICAGSYTVQVKDQCCTTYSTAVYTPTDVGLSFYSEENEFELYPNPVKDKIYLNITNSNYKNLTYTISDLSGRILLRDFTSEGPLKVGKLDNGIYFLSLHFGGGAVEKRKIMIMNE
jgi:hypothetical protein